MSTFFLQTNPSSSITGDHHTQPMTKKFATHFPTAYFSIDDNVMYRNLCEKRFYMYVSTYIFIFSETECLRKWPWTAMQHCKEELTRTQTSVLLLWEKRSGKQLVRCSTICHFDSDGSISVEGNAVFNSSRSLWKSGMLLDKDGRQVKRSACSL